MKLLAPNERPLAPYNLDGGPQVDTVRAPQRMNQQANQRNQSGEFPVGKEALERRYATNGPDDAEATNPQGSQVGHG